MGTDPVVGGWEDIMMSRFNCWGGSRGPRLCYSCFMRMYLECDCSLACLLSLWQYQLPGFSSTSGGLSPWFYGSILGDSLLFPCREYGGWAKTHHFLLLFHVFPSPDPQRYYTFECCLLGLQLNNNNKNKIIIIIIIIIIMVMMIQ